MATTTTFANNARFYAPAHLTRQLDTIAAADQLVVMIDIDALDRSNFARGDRVMLLALDELSRRGVQVVLASRAADRAAAVQRGVPSSWCVDVARGLHQIRERLRGAHAIAISDDHDVLAMLGPDDRGVALTQPTEVAVRAVLWWLVGARAVRRGSMTER